MLGRLADTPIAAAKALTLPAASMARSRAVIGIHAWSHERECMVLTNVTQGSDRLTGVKTLADRLRETRTKLGLTQPQLARRAGVSYGTIGNLEAGMRKNPRELLAIAAALGVRPEWLKDGVGPQTGDAPAPISPPPEAPTLGATIGQLGAQLSILDEMTRRALSPLLAQLAMEPHKSDHIAAMAMSLAAVDPGKRRAA